MGDHGTNITDGLAKVEQTGKGKFQVEIEGIKFEMPKGVAEELMASLVKALRPFAGYSIFDDIMMSLDTVIDRLMAGPDAEAEDGQDRGRAEAYTMALALIRNSYAPDYEGEKKRQMIRYDKRMSGEADSEVNRVAHRLSKRKEETEKTHGVGARYGGEPEEEHEGEIWICDSCGSEYNTEQEADECAALDVEEEEG